MKQQLLLFSTLFLLAISSAAVAEENRELLFEQKCSVCHLTHRPHADLMNTMVAPPIMGVMQHVKEAKATQAEAVAFVVDYIFSPSAANAVCMPQAIDRFGVMPSQRGNLSREEALQIAESLYDDFGSRGMGRKR